MTQYISKDAIVAEIERLKSIQLSIFSKGETDESCYKALSCISVYNEVLSFLNTLEMKEINNVWHDASDFPKAEAGRSILFIEDNGYTRLLKSPSAERLFYFRTTNLKMWAYVDELLSITTHSEVKETDLEKEATEFVQTKEFVESKESPVLLIAKHFYELGLKAQKGE